MRFKSLFILILILISLLSFVYFFERHAPSTEERLARAKKIFSFDEQAITSVTIKNTDSSSPFIINKESDLGVWRLTQPISLRANKNAIVALLTDVKFSTAKRELKVSETNLSELGLQTPAVKFDFLDDTYSYSLMLGKSTAVGDQVYALTSLKKINESHAADRHIVIIDKMIVDSLDVSLKDLRTQHVIPQWTFVPDSIVIERDSLKIKLEKHTDNTWYITEPLSRKADDTKINELLITLNNLKIIDYLTTQDQYGFESPRIAITLLEDSKEVSVLLGNEYDDNKRTYVKNNLETCVYGIDSKITPVLFSSLSQLSARYLIVPHKDDLRIIQIRRNAQELTIEYNDAQWNITNPVEVLADEQHITDMLDNLKSYKIDEYIVDTNQHDNLLSKIDINAVTVVLTTADQKERPISYTFFEDQSDSKQYVVDNMTESLRCISCEKESLIPSEAVDFAQTNVLRINRHLINNCLVIADSTQYKLKQKHGVLFCNDTQLTEDDSQKIYKALEEISIQNLIDIKTDENLRKHHLDTPSIEIHIDLSAKTPEGADNIDLLLGTSHDTVSYGYIADYPFIFIVDETPIRTLQQALIDASVTSDKQD